jgi:hypothetical protein
MLSDFSSFHWNGAELHAWNQGDIAALEGAGRGSNPYKSGPLFDAWDQGFLGFPLASPGRHDVDVMDGATLRTVPSLRAEFGAHGWSTGQGLHRNRECDANTGQEAQVAA